MTFMVRIHCVRALQLWAILAVVLVALPFPWTACAQEAVSAATDLTWFDWVGQLLTSPLGAAILAALWGASEALSMIPAIKANGVFQLVWSILKYVKNPKPV